MSAEYAARTPAPSPSTTSVDLPPRSTTTNGPVSAFRSPTAPAKDSAASSAPVITSATAPGTTDPSTAAVMAKNSSRDWRRPGSPRWPPSAPGRPRSGATSPRNPAVRPRCAPAHRRRTARWRRHPARSRTMRISRCRLRSADPSRSAISSRIELVPQSIAATRPDPSCTLTSSAPVSGFRPSPGRLPASPGLVTERVHTTALGQRMGHQHVQASSPGRAYRHRRTSS